MGRQDGGSAAPRARFETRREGGAGVSATVNAPQRFDRSIVEGPIVAAVWTASVGARAPYPPSASILGVDWAPATTIARRAEGSDNWPTTWGDDDALYTAYGDGRGFAPPAPRKLSLGDRINSCDDHRYSETRARLKPV